MLFFEDRTPFATGAAGYDDGQPESTEDARIMLEVQIAAQPVRAMVDTGAPFVVLDPELAEMLGYQSWEIAEDTRLRIRGIRYDGTLYRVDVQLFAEHGESHSVSATVFVPRLRPGDAWGPKPNFIGLSLLDRIRYAIDPSAYLFYFGPLA